MAWERRKETNRQYYYRHGRDFRGRAKKLYVGVGRDAHRIAEADAVTRQEQTVARQAWQRQWSEIEQAKQPLDEFCRLMALLTRGTLIASGWYQHGGSRWRRRMMTWRSCRL